MTTKLSAIAIAIITVAIIAAVTILTWHGSITGQAATAIFSSIIGGGIVGAAHSSGVKNGANAATTANAAMMKGAK